MGICVLDKETIKKPRSSRLALRLGHDSLHALVYNPNDIASAIYRRLPLEASSASLMKSLEEVVYDNPVLLSDFLQIDILIDTPRFAIVPDDIIAGDSDMPRALLIKAIGEEAASGEVIVDDMTHIGAIIVMSVDSDITAFLRRTFNNPVIRHNLSPQCRYFFDKNRIDNAGKMYVNLRRDAMDIIVLGNDSLRMANTFRFRDIMDAVYYIMACRDMLDLDPAGNELLIAGDEALRDEITPILRKFLGYVMPVVPPTYILKDDEQWGKAPFDLIILPLCE